MPRGIDDERQLARLLWKKGFAVVRAPASGSSTRMPRPDLLAGHSGRGIQFAIEVKTTHNSRIYIARKAVNQLNDFSQRFGCQPILALKFRGAKRGWVFVTPQHLSTTPALNFKITLAEALQKGMDLTTLIKDSRQTKLLS